MINLTDGTNSTVEFYNAVVAQPDACERGTRWLRRASSQGLTFQQFLDNLLNDPVFKTSWVMWCWDKLNDILSPEVKLYMIKGCLSNRKAVDAYLRLYGEKLTTEERNLLKS